MIRLRVHDPTALELQLDVPFQSGGADLEVWFFLPSQLGVDDPGFDRDRFYRERTAYVRFEAPRRLLLEADALLGALRVDRARLSAGTASPSVEAAAVRALRLYGACVRDQLRERRQEAEHASAVGREAAVRALVEDGEAVLERYRSTMASITRPSSSFATALRAVNDYLSMQTIEVWFRLHASSPHPVLEAAIRKETGARITSGFHGELAEADAVDNEHFVTELNRLKKYILSVLHLRFVSTHRTEAAQDLAFGLAAALAMTVAVFFQLVALWTVGTPGGPRDWASLSMFLAFAVGGYILKDRMKDHLKGWFARRLPGWLYDRRVELCPEGEDTVLGHAEETVRRLHLPEVAADVVALRDRGEDPIELVVRASDDVVHYRRRLRLLPTLVAQCPEADGVEQILRIHVRDWLRRMDEPSRALYQLDDDGHAHRIHGPKTYRIPVVIRVQRGGETDMLRRVLVLSRQGVVRIEG